MAIIDLFSKRMKRKRGEFPDVYTYDTIPRELRIQVVHILESELSAASRFTHGFQYFETVVVALRHEYGVFRLPNNNDYQYDETSSELVAFFLSEENIDRVIDVIEYSFDERHFWRSRPLELDSSIRELNQRFREHGVGYQLENGKIIKMTDEFTHSNIVKPALQLLSDPIFDGANQEFLKAHEHYRKGDSKESMNECLKAFESVMKVICDKHNWTYEHKKSTSSILLKTCFENGLISRVWESEFNSLITLLQSGIPTGRNTISGHGQGKTVTNPDDEVVEFMMNMTASSITFLCQADKKLQ